MFALFSRSARGPIDPELSPSSPEAPGFAALAAEAELAWPLAAPPETPPQIAAAFSSALEAISYDRAAVEEAQRAGITLDPIPADVVAERVRALHALAPEWKARLAPLYGGR